MYNDELLLTTQHSITPTLQMPVRVNNYVLLQPMGKRIK